MSLKQISFYNYRNLKNGTLDLDIPSIVLRGNNGQGKTNFLEAVYLLCYGSSFRTKKEKTLCLYGTDEMAVSGIMTNKQSGMDSVVSVSVVKGIKKIKIDNKNIEDRKEIIRMNPCIIFCHNDISFVNGTQEKKRWFFNQTLSLYDSFFIDILRNYKRIMKERNFCLREKKMDLIDIYTVQLAEKGKEIQEKRSSIIDIFNDTFRPVVKKIIDMDLFLEYCPSFGKNADPEEIFQKSLGRDLSLGITTKGPHRDSFVFRYDKRDFVEIASTGQIRLLSLILRIVQAKFFSKLTGYKPILLIDDVLLELDTGRRKKIIEEFPEYSQIFLTFLPDETMNINKNDIMEFDVVGGSFNRTGRWMED